jgi:hypothetical protein
MLLRVLWRMRPGVKLGACRDDHGSAARPLSTARASAGPRPRRGCHADRSRSPGSEPRWVVVADLAADPGTGTMWQPIPRMAVDHEAAQRAGYGRPEDPDHPDRVILAGSAAHMLGLGGRSGKGAIGWRWVEAAIDLLTRAADRRQRRGSESRLRRLRRPASLECHTTNLGSAIIASSLRP